MNALAHVMTRARIKSDFNDLKTVMIFCALGLLASLLLLMMCGLSLEAGLEAAVASLDG